MTYLSALSNNSSTISAILNDDQTKSGRVEKLNENSSSNWVKKAILIAAIAINLIPLIFAVSLCAGLAGIGFAGLAAAFKASLTVVGAYLTGITLIITCVANIVFGFIELKKMQPDVLKIINRDVLATVNSTKEIPGLDSKVFPTLKSEICKNWETIFNKGVLEVSGKDKDFRPNFVALQGVVEHVLSNQLNKNIKNLKGVIHTPMPATPLCTKGEISKELVDPSIEKDEKRLFTVKARTTIIRDFLHKGGDLHVIYPKEGIAKRNEEQQGIYKKELQNNASHLFDKPLDTAEIPTDLIGATYFFEDQDGKKYVFAIKMTQANDPKDLKFGLWFGAADHPAVKERLKAVSTYLEQNGCNIMKPYL